MTGSTHKLITLKAMDHFELTEKEKNDFLRGNVIADFIPFYNYRKHYPRQSMEYVLDMNKKIDNFFELGIFSHFVSDFLCTPHFKHWKLYSSKALKHIKFEKNLEKAAAFFDYSAVDVHGHKRGCINDAVLKLYANAGEGYDDNILSAYFAVCFMLGHFV